jgi:hypothetical protein
MEQVWMISGVATDHCIDSEIARAWTIRVLDDVPYLYANQLRGVIANRQRFTSVREMADEDFLHGLYLGLCDYFNGGCEIEDMTDEVCELLGLPLTGIKSSATLAREKRDAARAVREHEERLRREEQASRWRTIHAG